MPIQNATLEQCVSGLKRTVDRQAETIERQAAEIERLREALRQILALSTDKRAADRAAREIGEARP